jgi:polysaccharide export outer membrane protein
MGQVKEPGAYRFERALSLVQAVARAGGFGQWANSKVTVIRQKNEVIPGSGQDKSPSPQGQKFEFDYDDYLKGKDFDKNILLEPGDVVIVH